MELLKAQAPEAAYRMLHRVADAAEPELRRAILRTLRRLQTGLGTARLEELLASGDPMALERTGFWRAVEAELGAAIDPQLRVTIVQAGQRVARRSPEFGVRFDLTNPRAVQAAEHQAGALIREITDESRMAVRRLVERSLRGEFDVPTLARQVRNSIGLTTRYADAVETYRERLIKQGRGEGVALDLSEQYAGRLLRDRAQTIARTEVIRAANLGQQAVWEDAVQSGLLRADRKRSWLVTPDDRLCINICAPMDGQERGLNEPFTTGEGDAVMTPPAHPQCRCALGLTIEES